MAHKKSNADNAIPIDDCYQISDDDMDDYEEDSLLEETDEPPGVNGGSSGGGGGGNGGRGPYERAWTTDATRALIHIRGPMEDRFTEGRQKRTALWLHCTRQLQKMGYRYSSGKVQKKWHNILITYNKNLSKKYLTGYVHWEFFEDMFKYLEGKKADCDPQFQQQHQLKKTSTSDCQSRDGKRQTPSLRSHSASTHEFISADHSLLMPKVMLDSKSNDDEFDEDSDSVIELKEPKQEYNDMQDEMPVEVTHDTMNYEVQEPSPRDEFAHLMHVNGVTAGGMQTEWWRDYFERKLDVERQKLKLQREMHREQMEFKQAALAQQDKIERIKIEAINSLTGALQKLAEVNSKNV